MTIFRPNTSKQQDFGGVYKDGCEHKQYDDHIVDINYSGQHSESDDCCSDVCLVDSSGNPLSKNGAGCWVVPNGGGSGTVTLAIDDVEYSGNSLIFTYTDDSTLEISGVGDQIQCYRDSFALGKQGTVIADASVGIVPPQPITDLGNQTIVDARATLSASGTTDTIFEIFKASNVTGPWTSLGSFTIPAGDKFLDMSGLVGEILPASSFVASQVTTGSNAEDLNVVVTLQDCDGTAQISTNNSSLAIAGYRLSYDRGDGSSPDLIDLPQVSGVELGVSGTTVYFEMGQGGELVAEPAPQWGDRWVVPSGYSLYVSSASVMMRTPGTGNTVVAFYATADTGTGAAPVPGAAVASITMPSGIVQKNFPAIIGNYGSEYHLQEIVTSVAGTGASDMVVGIVGQLYEL